MNLVVFWIKGIVILIWLSLGFFTGMILGLFRWGNRNLNHILSKIICPVVLKVAGIEVHVEGREHLQTPHGKVILSNHQSMFDLMTLGSIIPRDTIAIGKYEVLYLPFVNLYFFAGGNIAIKRNNRAHSIAGLTKAAEAIKQDNASVWLFPEGTRNKTSNPLGPFKKGAFYLAIDAEAPLVPMVSAPLKPYFDWNQKRIRPGILRIRILEPINTKGLTRESVEALLNETYAKMEQVVKELTLQSQSG